MITVEEAQTIVMNTATDWGTEEIDLLQSLNRVLAENWYSDRPLPPYDRVTMDGIAIQYSAFEKGIKSFKIQGIAAAGDSQNELIDEASCLEVMTGSVLPKNSNVVIRYEDLDIENGFAQLKIDTVDVFQSIHRKGVDRSQGDVLAEAGIVISAAEIGVAASIGQVKVQVKKLPKIIIISTGDELVEIDQQPQSHQIRKSNVHRIKSTLHHLNIQADTAHLNDDKMEIKAKLSQCLSDYDAILISGGVSKGKFDFLPKVLHDLGVEKLFHRISQRPGKPFWFGQKGQCKIFAFPGNPISSFLCTHKYFVPWLESSLGIINRKKEYALLNSAVTFKPNLTYFLEVSLHSNEQGQLLAEPRKGNGSGDLANLVRADAFIELPKGQNIYESGIAYPVLRFR